jgi:serine phosphatase RsbU (regulator of sigma subunit)
MSDRASKISRKIPKAKESAAKKITKAGKKKTGAGTSARKGKTGRHTKRTKTKAGRTTKVGKSVKREAELESITPFNRGMSIGIKFAVLTGAVVGVFMALLGWLTYSISSREMDAQIKDQGVSIVSALEKAIDRGFWIEQEEPARSGNDNQPERLQKTPEELGTEWNRRFRGIVADSDGKILVVAVMDKAKGNAMMQNPVALSVDDANELAIPQSALGKVGKIEIFDGEFGGVRIRRFDRAIDLESFLSQDIEINKLIETLQDEDPDGATFKTALKRLRVITSDPSINDATEATNWRDLHPGYSMREEAKRFDPVVSVFIKADRLDTIKSALWNRIAIVTLCGAAAGILLTMLITAVLTGPIRELEQDIGQVAEGDLSHQSRVRVRDEIGALAHVFNIMTRNLKTAQNNAVERKAFERELNIAKEIQEKLLPERIPQIPGIDIHSHYKSAKEVGGDYYDFIVIDQTHLGIIVADVAGKGIPGAMVMTMARSLVRLASVRNVSPGDTFKKVNRILAKDIRRGMFVTAAYMVLNVKTKTLRVASAGHNPVVLYRAKSGENELIKPAGIALGFDKGTIFDNHIKEVEVQLESGDRIVTYTDGVNEAMNNNSEEFGDERFYELVKSHARKPSKDFVEAIVRELDKHRGDAEQSDDITITTLTVTGAKP